ncbi:ATPase/GTPase, AAA15 family [Hymenobacter daecheongensis DSM 21074]|uniref:ATPase/GTPase, AAA15 family n=1 Tax=Hymenobacter daecheongensis DSM 21074 TaxID=1121955 RepID=A0A1M6B660_9BACT|nr:AAA family ATPase [Hymenobacter daecheongensis]SHI43963.1 ATPase/GTPase, AAA15 family [Hymenobacter daecheongensis DSM 21074]
MLKRLHVRNFTVFADADFEFVQGLNVIVGTNGTGKSHVLKLGYAVEMIREQVRNLSPVQNPAVLAKKEDEWGSRLFYYLPDLFQTALLKNMVSTREPHQNAVIDVEFLSDSESENEKVRFEVNPGLNSLQVTGGRELTSKQVEVVSPVFIPAKEVLTLSWMLPASEQFRIPVEQNYLHLLKQLRFLPLRVSGSTTASALATVLGGEVQEEGDKYYLVSEGGQRTEMNMVAEGLRKFGTLQKLLENGSLTPKTTLFWDEPEANLNPLLLRELAKVLASMARQGFQIIVATHSMSLLKEFHILSRQKDAKPLPIKYFGLNAGPGEATRVLTADNFEYLPDVVALEVELEQADDLDEIFAKEDRERHANL